jgi:hypothetical protein
MKPRLAATVCGFASVLLAHHSVPGQYDISKTITIRGVFTKTEWMNPHARFWVDANNDDGTVSKVTDSTKAWRRDSSACSLI